MIHRLEIDLSTANYRRVFRQIFGKLRAREWTLIRRRGFLFHNCRGTAECVSDNRPAKRVHYVGSESEEEIKSILDLQERDEQQEGIFVVTLDRNNLYCFSTDTLDRATVIFVLSFVPDSLEDRHQLFNLFHKSLMMRRVGSLLYYYSRVIDMLTTTGPLPAGPPDLIESLGPRAIIHQFFVLRDRIRQKFDRWHRRSERRAAAGANKNRRGSDGRFRHVVITGWYGSETAGDKAILQELVHVLQEKAPGIRISITSIIPGLSRLTNLELQLDAEILELRDIDYRRLGTVDLVVFGGGPLMDSSQLRFIDTLFAWARGCGIATLIFGCGVGPLKTSEGLERVKNILRHVDQAFFRDERSAAEAQRLGFSGHLLHACDPAMRYVERWRERRATERPGKSGRQIVTLLRAQTAEYSRSVVAETRVLEEELSGFIRSFLQDDPERDVVMLPMHTFWLGNDDRDYNREIAARLPGDVRVHASNTPLLLDTLLEKISNATWGMPMRYHGHIFMLALNVPFVSINYTGPGGKVANLIERYALGDFSLSVAGISEPGALLNRWRRLQVHSEDVQSQTRTQFQNDLRRLERAYEQVFRALAEGEPA